MIPVYKPYLPAKSLTYAHEALDSTWISSQGKYLQQVREKLQELLGVQYVLPVNNGTSACHLMAKGLARKLNIKGKRSILVPDNCYVAAWNSLLFDDQYKLITVKTDINTWNIDLHDLDMKINIYPNAPVLIVHNIGNIINVPELQKKYPNTVFIEDACETFTGKYQNQHSGTVSFINAFSTFANKTICSGEGGFITTNDEKTYDFLKCIHSQGQSSKRYIHDELGTNFRMTNVQAAILLGQLEILPEITERKTIIFQKYRDAFKNRDDVFIQQEAFNTQHANWMFGLRIQDSKSFDVANNFFSSRGIETRPMFYEITAHAHLRDNKNVIADDLSNARLLNQQCVIFPSYPELTDEEQKHIIETIQDYVKSK